MRFTIALLGCILMPFTSAAQVQLPRHDATISIGWAGSRYDLGRDHVWRGSLFLSAAGGHYWTNHLKTDLEAGWSSRSDAETYEPLTISGFPTYALSTYRVRDLRVTLAQSYQFGRNEWIHPFIGAGADVIRRETVLDRAVQMRFPSTPPSRPPVGVTVPPRRESDTDILVRPFLKTGVKMYASPRVFVTTDFKVGLAPHLDHSLWRLGLGFDF